MVRKSSLFAKPRKGSSTTPIQETSCGTSLGSDGSSDFDGRKGSQSSEESVIISSGENVPQLMHSTSTDEFKRYGLGTYDALDSETSDLDFYYGIVKRNILRHQSVINGLFPSNSSETKIGSVRDTIYSCMASWSLYLAYRQYDDTYGKGYELGQSVVMGMQGILACWMRQATRLENFKLKQGKEDPLHAIFDMETSEEVKSTTHYNQLQIDVISLYLLFLVETISSGLDIISSLDEVNFVQNLVYYVERSYRIPDFGMWERGSTSNDGTSELNASSIGMAKAALEAIGGFNLFGKGHGATWSTITVDTDAHNRNREIFETMLPRESASRRIDFATFVSISFPGFALSNGTDHLADKLYNKTKKEIIAELTGAGEYGFKRFLCDGYHNSLETTVDGHFYHEGKILEFEGIENEWPMLYLYMIIDGVFIGDDVQVEKYQKLLQRRLAYSENGDPLVPKYYSVPYQNIRDERNIPGSQKRVPSKEGSSESNIFLWGQSLLIIAELLTTRNLLPDDLDVLGRVKSPGAGSLYQRASHLRRTIGLNEKNVMSNPKELTPEKMLLQELVDDVVESGNSCVVQVVIISESRQLQATLNTFGIHTQTPSEVEPIQIWSQWEMVRILQQLGQNQKLMLTGRPPRPIGVLGTCKLYRVDGKTVLCYPLSFSATDFYLGHDLALLTANIKSDLKFVSQRWHKDGQYGTIASSSRTRLHHSHDASRPTYCIVITENNLQDPQFPELLNFLCELRHLKVDGVKIRLGRLQNLMATAVVENLDFTNMARFCADRSDENANPPNNRKKELFPSEGDSSDLYQGENSDSNLKRGGRFRQVRHAYLGFAGHIRTDVPKSTFISSDEKRDFVSEYIDKPSPLIAHEIIDGSIANNLFGKIQLLGILLHRHGNGFVVGNSQLSVKTYLENLNRQAGTKRHWSALRYSSALLRQMIESISPYLAHILVNRKQITFGTIGGEFELFTRQPGPVEIEEALYNKVYSFPHSVTPVVLQQEIVLYCGKLIATNPELFSGILKVRMSWILRAMETYHGMMKDSDSNNDATLDSLPPSKIMRLLYEVLSESKLIQFNYDESSNSVEKLKQSKQSKSTSQGDNNMAKQASCRLEEKCLNTGACALHRIKQLSVFQTRQINGCLIRAPTTFYTDIWKVLSKCPAGIRIKGKHLPQQPTISIMSSSDESFAHLIEEMLNIQIKDPVEKQMAVETFCVICTIMRRHPELYLSKQEEMDIGQIMDQAVNLYSLRNRDSNDIGSQSNQPPATPTEYKDLPFDDSSFNLARRKFFNESVSTTSIYLARVTINIILNNISLEEAMENAALSKYQCPVQ